MVSGAANGTAKRIVSRVWGGGRQWATADLSFLRKIFRYRLQGEQGQRVLHFAFDLPAPEDICVFGEGA